MVNGYVIGASSELRNSTSLLAVGSHNVELAPYTNSEFHFNMSEDATTWMATHSDMLTVTLDLTFMGATAQDTLQYYWNAPGP
jgi:hypothetical protein